MKENKLQTYGIYRLVKEVFYFSRDGRKDNSDEGSRRKK